MPESQQNGFIKKLIIKNNISQITQILKQHPNAIKQIISKLNTTPLSLKKKLVVTFQDKKLIFSKLKNKIQVSLATKEHKNDAIFQTFVYQVYEDINQENQYDEKIKKRSITQRQFNHLLLDEIDNTPLD